MTSTFENKREKNTETNVCKETIKMITNPMIKRKIKKLMH